MSRYEYPEDEFDAEEMDGAPQPIGVHRAQVPAWRSWAPLLAILLIVPLLAWGAVALLGRNSGKPSAGSTTPAPAATTAAAAGPSTSGAAPSAGPSAAPSAAPSATSSAPPANIDMSTGVTVYNGTTTKGLAGRTGDRLTNAGYTAVAVPQGTYPNENPQASTVFYARPENKATAEAVAQALGISQVVESPAEAQSNPVVVVLRADYHE